MMLVFSCHLDNTQLGPAEEPATLNPFDQVVDALAELGFAAEEEQAYSIEIVFNRTDTGEFDGTFGESMELGSGKLTNLRLKAGKCTYGGVGYEACGTFGTGALGLLKFKSFLNDHFGDCDVVSSITVKGDGEITFYGTRIG